MPPVPTYQQNGDSAPSEENPLSESEQQEQPQSQTGFDSSNITDDTIRELSLDALRHHNDKEEAMKAVRSANGNYRAVLKRAKKLGGEKTKVAIEQWIQERLMEPTDLNAWIVAKNRQWLVMQLPAGTQLGMFDSNKSIATKLEDLQRERSEKSAVDQAADAYDVGYEAGKAGHPTARTGFNETHDHWAEFLRGYSAGQKELMSASDLTKQSGSSTDTPAASTEPTGEEQPT
jgi:hypothetical protein